MKTLITITCAAVLLLAQACTLKDIITPVSGTTATSDSYQPVTKGSTWTYNMNIVGATKPDILTIKMTGNTSVINGKTYYEANSTSASTGSGNGYYYNNGIVYTSRGTAAGVSGITAEFQYLDLSKPIGQTWTTKASDSGYINGVPAQIVGQIIEKGLTKTIGGKTFTDVLHVTMNLQYDYGMGFETSGTYDYYLCKGIGLIEEDANFFGIDFMKQTIASYSVK